MVATISSFLASGGTFEKCHNTRCCNVQAIATCASSLFPVSHIAGRSAWGMEQSPSRKRTLRYISVNVYGWHRILSVAHRAAIHDLKRFFLIYT